MAKRPTVEVDEEYLKEVMAGGAVIPKKEQPGPEPDGETVSTGMTYEQISQALDVVQGRQTDEAGKAAAARILYEIEGSAVFDFLAAQAENEAIIEKLIKENIDSSGEPVTGTVRKKQWNKVEFDMGKYV